MNINDIIPKYVELLYKTFLHESIERCRSKATYQFDTINSYGEVYEIAYFRMLSEKNVALAVHIFSYYTKCTNISSTKIKEILAYQTVQQLLMLEKYEFIDLHQVKKELFLSQKENVAIDENLSNKRDLQIAKLNNLADICYASLVLNDSELIHSVFCLIGNIIKDDESCDKSVDRFIEQLNSTSELVRGSLAVRFLSLIYSVVKPINSEFSLKMILHFKLISTIVGKEYVSELIKLCEMLIHDREYRFLRHVIGCFSEVSLERLAIDERVLAKKLFNEYPTLISSQELFHGLRTVENFNTRAGNVNERLDYWWEIVEDSFKSTCREKEDVHKFLKKYYCLRRIQNNPQAFLQIKKIDDKCPNEIDFELIDVEEQKATIALILSCPENVETFLEWLGDWNYYKFNESERKFRWAASDNNGRTYISILLKHYTSDKTVYIYMNSFLRSVVPINILLHKLYDISDRQRDDHLMVKKIFSPYRMCAKIFMYGDKLSFESVSFTEKGMNIHNLSDTVLAKLKEYYDKNKNDSSFAYLHFHIAAALVNSDFTPDIHLEYEEFLDQDVRELNVEAFSKCIDLLSELATIHEIDNEKIAEFNKLPYFPTTPERAGIIGMSIIRVLNNLTNNKQRVIVLRQLKINPYAYNRTKGLDYGNLRNNDLLKSFMRKVVKENSFFENKFYIYFNTALRLNINFHSFIAKSELLNGRFFLNKMFLYQNIYCIGRVFRIFLEGDKKTVIIRPRNVISSTQTKYVLYTNSTISFNDMLNFVINYYDDERKEFVIGEYKIIPRKNTFYFDATAKARITLNLNEIDRKNLQKKMDPYSVKQKSKILAIYEAEAIRLRKDDYTELSDYLALIKKGSPWKFSTEQLPCFFNSRKKCGFVDSMLVDIIRNYDADFVTDLYFNTSLRSLVSLDELCHILKSEGKLNKKVMNEISEYPLRLNFYIDHLRGYNVLFLRDLDELLTNNTLTDNLYVAYDYDKKNNRVKLKILSENSNHLPVPFLE